YAWIDASKDHWREQVEIGDVILVCDVGGGTTDLSLIAVSEEAGQLVLTRVAVGDHILLGGDNMDLALAHHAARGFAERGGVLVDGCFPPCALDAVPQRQRTAGLQEIGLPYAADPAVTKHLAQFLARNAEVLSQRGSGKRGKKKSAQPAAVLFNGGVFKA